MNSVPNPNPSDNSSVLPAILANLSDEIRRPLNQLHEGISSLLAIPPGELTESERSQAATMLSLCEEIDQLTRVFLS
jgi:hypothetical protein